MSPNICKPMSHILENNDASIPRAIIMVGLPARGKTSIACKLTRYLKWRGLDTKVFNVGQYRRKAVPVNNSQADFFNPNNEEARSIREECAEIALTEMCDWLMAGGEVAVYDATNSIRERRRKIMEIIEQKKCIQTFFIESICSDQSIIDANIRVVKVSSPDYQNKDKDSAIEDFKSRIVHYESVYEPLDQEHDKHLSFIKIFNQGQRFLVNKLRGHVESKVVYYLMNIHVLPRTIYITRHGEGDRNVKGQVGIDSALTQKGKQFAQNLAQYMREEVSSGKVLRVWTSVMQQSLDTASYLTDQLVTWKALGALDAGICEGLTYKEIEERHPDIYRARLKDKFHYRYPDGESYQDLVVRLEPVILELERNEDVIVVASQAVCRCLYAYFMDLDLDELPYKEIPLHTVYKLMPMAYDCKLEEIHIPPSPDADTYFPRPTNILPLTSEEKRVRRRQISMCDQPECCGKLACSR